MNKADLSLYGIVRELEDIDEKIAEQGGEINEGDEALLDLVQKALTDKVDGVVGFVKYQENFISQIEQRIAELTNLKNARKKNLDRFNDYVIQCMTKMGVEKLRGEFDEVILPKKRDIVCIDDPSALPIEFVNIKEKIEHKPDKKKIMDAFKSGKDVTGAYLGQGDQSIKYKAGQVSLPDRKEKKGE